VRIDDRVKHLEPGYERIFQEIDAVYALNFDFKRGDFGDEGVSPRSPYELVKSQLIYADPARHTVELSLQRTRRFDGDFLFKVKVNGVIVRAERADNAESHHNSFKEFITEEAKLPIVDPTGGGGVEDGGDYQGVSYAKGLVLIQVEPSDDAVEKLRAAYQNAGPDEVIANLQGWVIVRRKAPDEEPNT
jgi:hypothetical protein